LSAGNLVPFQQAFADVVLGWVDIWLRVEPDNEPALQVLRGGRVRPGEPRRGGRIQYRPAGRLRLDARPQLSFGQCECIESMAFVHEPFRPDA